jgi:cytidine deaminase
MQDLVKAAMAARAKAHAPYSKFYVGAAMRDEHGHIHAGCNIENAAYPQGWCAEPSAISHLILAGGRKIVEVAVIGNGNALCTPCGDLIKTFTLGEFLPASFGPENLL